MEPDMIGFAQCLINHPIKSQSERVKKNYIDVLEYMTSIFSNNDSRASVMLCAYKKHILGSDSQVICNEATAKKAYKQVVKNRIKSFKIHSFRYYFIFDCIYINAYNNPDKIEKILCHISDTFKSKHNGRIRMFVEQLVKSSFANSYEGMDEHLSCWNANKEHLKRPLKKIVFTANMSAGKSTIINALVGQTVTKTSEEACTQFVSCVYNKPYDDGFVDVLNPQYNIVTRNEFEEQKMFGVGSSIAVNFHNCYSNKERICLVDTPGVNSAINKQHKSITQKFIKDEKFDTLVYVFNAEVLGTDDEIRYLKFIFENVPENKIVFVINKLDIYKKNSDTVRGSIDLILEDLHKIGFKHPRICPISARYAYLQKLADHDYYITDDEEDELDFYIRKFKREAYNLSLFYDEKCDMTNNENYIKCGFYNLEKTLYKGDN